MRKEIADLWCDALESGEYTQGIQALCSNGEYCCLGVLTDLYNKKFGDLYIYRRGCFLCYDNQESVLPKKVVEWAGMRTSDGTITNLKINKINYYNLTCLNDFSEWDFKEISGFIKEHWEKL
jgi:hypothetical protein